MCERYNHTFVKLTGLQSGQEMSDFIIIVCDGRREEQKREARQVGRREAQRNVEIPRDL